MRCGYLRYKILRPENKSEGAGAEVMRLFPSSSMEHHDPFVLLDEFFVDPDTGFPTHRHAGFEALTYMLEGSFRHKDNLDNDSTVGDGGVQKFTAGSGIEHSEMPGSEEKAHGFQLWINLPKDKKDQEPSYQRIEAEEVLEIVEGNTRIRTVVGEGSPVELETPVLYKDMKLEKGGSTSIEFLEGYTGFLYVYRGEVILKGDDGEEVKVSEGRACFPYREERLSVGGTEKSSFIFVSGKPIGDEIELAGSIVK